MIEIVGVVVARFQVPELTHGHKKLLDTVFAENNFACVVLGTTSVPDRRNPLTFEMRRDMLYSAYPRLHLVLQHQDLPGQDKEWSDRLDRMLRMVYPTSRIRLYGGRDSFLASYKGNLEQVKVKEHWEAPGTAYREELAAGSPTNSSEFRKGVIWSVLNYVKAAPAVAEPWEDKKVRV